jgi:hypothetical protein
MAKKIPLLFTLLLLCCGKDPQPKHCDSLCEDEKIKAEYQKRFGLPMSDFELAIKNVHYYIWDYDNSYDTLISLTRTPAGMYAKFMNTYEPVQYIKLNIGEWLDFVNALHKCNIRERKSVSVDILFGGHKLEVLSSDTLTFTFPVDFKTLAPDTPDSVLSNGELIWVDVIRLMDSTKAKAERVRIAKMNSELKREYEKRFGLPISDFELSINNLTFCNHRSGYGDYITRVARNTTSAYAIHSRGIGLLYKPVELTQEEWLDFVNALYKIRVNSWKKEYDMVEKELDLGFKVSKYPDWLWRLEIFSDKDTIVSSHGAYLYPPNWDEFMKIMDDMEKKAK